MISTLFSSLGQAFSLYFDLSKAVIGWQAGGLAQTNWKMLAIIAPFILVGLVLAQLMAHQLTILYLDETVAKALGQKTLATTIGLLSIVSYFISCCCCFGGKSCISWFDYSSFYKTLCR